MAMNKKENAYVEKLEMELALRWTAPVEKDVEIPKTSKVIVSGFSHTSTRVTESCSSTLSHSTSSTTRANSKDPIKQFSSRLLALKSLRHSIELESAKRLFVIDKQIAEEMI